MKTLKDFLALDVPESMCNETKKFIYNWFGEYIKELETALTNILDGQLPRDIQAMTGLPIEKCMELERLFIKISKTQIN